MTRAEFEALPLLVRVAATNALATVIHEIHERAMAKRPKPKDYEVHHENETARNAILAVVEREPTVNINVYANAARESVSLGRL